MILADLDIDPQIIIVFVAMIFAALKAVFEKFNQSKSDHQQDYTPDFPEYF